MDRNYPGTGFGDLGAGWSYERSAKASLVYGSSRSSHPESELLHRQAYGTPHPLQGYATNHHPGSSGQGGAWGAGRSLGLSGLFDTGLHHASPSGPDASVMNLISALESQRGPQPQPSASSLLSQFRTPSWQTAMHTPAPAELFISGSGSFPSSSALSAYQHPASFSSRSFPTLQDTPTFSPTSNGLLSPHDPLLHIKGPAQSSLGFDRLLSSQGAAAAYRGAQDSTGAASSAQASSALHIQSHQFNLLSSQLQDQSSQLYNASVFSSAQAQAQAQAQVQAQAQSNSVQERAVPRQDSVIKHYQRPTPSQSQLSSSAAHSLQQYLSCGGAGYQQIAHPRHAGLSCSPLGDQSPSSDHKASSRTEQVYRPIIQPPYSSSSSSAVGKGAKSNSSSGYSSASSVSSSRTPHTPPSASSTSSTSSSSSSASGAHPSNSIPPSSSSSGPSRQQPPTQSAPPAPQQQQPPPTSSSSAQQPLPKHRLSSYSSPAPLVKPPTAALAGQTPPQPQTQSYSPSQPPLSHLPQSYGGFSSPQAQDLSSSGVRKGYGSLGGQSQSYSADVVYGTDSAYGSLPSSLGGEGSPSIGYGPGHSPALLRSGGPSGGGTSGGGGSSSSGGGTSGSGGGATSSMVNERGGGGGGSYHIPESIPSPSANSGIIRPGLHSPAPTCPTKTPGGTGSNKYISSVLSPTFMSSPQGYPDTRGPRPQSYHPNSSKTKSDPSSMLGVGSQRSQEDVDDDFLIQHLFQAQASPASQESHHHSQQQQSQQTAQQQAPPQPVSSTTDGGKGLSSYELGKSSEERCHLQSVIRTHSATSSTESGGGVTGLDRQLEMSLKKQQQQQRNDRRGGGRIGGRGSTEQSHPLHHSLGSVVHYGRGDPYSLGPQHTSHPQQQHTASHAHLQSLTQMDPQKKPQEHSELVYPRKTPEVQQQQHSQSQASATLMDSPTHQSRQTPHLLQSVLSHTTRNKMEPHQQQQHSVSQQQAMMDGAGGRMGPNKHQTPTQQASQLQLQLQSQALEAAVAATHYSQGPPQQDQSQSKQQQQSSVVSSLDMLECSLSQTSSTDGGGVEGRRGGGSGGGSGECRMQQEQQRLSSHHPQHSEVHSLLSEPDMGLSASSQVHHLPQHHQQQQHPNSHHQQSHSGHHSQGHAHPLSNHLPPPSASTHSQQQKSQSHPSQLTLGQQVQLDQQQRSEQNPFDTVSPVEKSGGQSQNHFVPLTSICFPDSLLQDEDRSFFPGMEDMFCSDDYSKSSCTGGSAGPMQGEMNKEGPGDGHEETMKANSGGGSGGGSGRASYDMHGHHGGDQGYVQYCHGLSESGTSTMDLDSLKTHELPSTVNTEQLGLIQLQGPGGMGVTGPGKLSSSPGGGAGGTGVSPGGLTSPIFCSSRPKKLLKSSSFHLLKERRDPNTLPKKSYAQEYEFEDDEDKDNQPADIRLNSRRLPDLLPDLVSSCRKTGVGAGGGGTLSPLMGDLNFYHTTGYPPLGPPPQLMSQDMVKKRGRKPTKQKRDGPPRPRGRPRIRPQPEQHTPCEMLTGEMGGGTGVGGGNGGGMEGKLGRDRGGGCRVRRNDMFMEMTRKDHMQQHHHQQQQHQLHHQAPQHQEPIPPLKIKLPIGSMSSSDDLLRIDSLSGTDPALSDGSVGSAPSLGLSPGPPCGGTDSNRTQNKSKQNSQMLSDGVDGEGMDGRVEEKDSESKAGFMASFMDFLKSGKRPQGLEMPMGMESGHGDTSPLKCGGLCPLSPVPPPFGEGEGNGGLALVGCPSPCKRTLDDELKRNLETLPSFSSDEEDSVGKNQDLQKSISSAISALYDTPQLAFQPPPPQPQPRQAQHTSTPLQPPTLSPQTPSHTPHTQLQAAEPAVLQREDREMEENDDDEEERKMGGGGNESEVKVMEEEAPEFETLGAHKLEASLPESQEAPVAPPPPSASPAQSFSPSPPPSPLPPLSLPSSPLPPQEEAQQQKSQPLSPLPPFNPSPLHPAHATLPLYPSPLHPASATLPLSSPLPQSSPATDIPKYSPEPRASPEEAPASQVTSLHVAQKQEDAAIAGESEEDESESGGEGIFRERDEFVVRVEDIATMKLALKTGREPPPIWRVQKALLQKFSPEIKDGERQFCATSNYLGYFGDAKRRYQRLYVKFLENVNKKDFVRVCSRRPWHRPSGLRYPLGRQALPKIASPPPTTLTPPRAEREQRVALPREPVQREPRERTRAKNEQREKATAGLKEKQREKERRVQLSQEKPEKRAAAVATMERGKGKEEKKGGVEKEKMECPPKSKPAKVKAEPPLKKRKKWLKEVPSSSDSDSSEEAASEDEMPVRGGVNNRAMREMFRSYVEMLVSTALDPDMIQALEDTDDELYLPGMRKIDGIIVEQKRRLMRRINMGTQHQDTLHTYPQMAGDPLDSGTVRVRFSGEGYNRKTLNRVKKSLPKPQDLKLSTESCRIYSLYHSLHHYKYHTFLHCKKETNTIEQAAEDPGQEEVVQQCMANHGWLDTLFNSFIELLTLSTKA
nr:proline-rich protein 12-like isoform X1 [Oncorhynchus nerka]